MTAAGWVPIQGAVAAEAPPALVSLGLAGGWQSATALAGGDAAFTVPEADQGARDLNGDGDGNDYVVHVWRATSGNVDNLGVALSGTSGGPGMMVALDGGGLAFAVPEAAQGRDLNGDGDAVDSVVHRWTAGGGLLNLRSAVKFQTVCCNSDKYELAPVPGGDVAFLLPEADQGRTDRNGDGDSTDTIAVVWDHGSGQVRDLGAAKDVKGLGNGHVAVITAESGQGVDLNGDGDKKDGVAQVWRRTSDLLNLKHAVFGVVPFGPRLALLVSEVDHKGADRNGDGDTDDSVIAVWDPADGATVQNLEIAEGKLGSNVMALEQGHLAFRGHEDQHGADLNGDGDESDDVVHIFDPATKRVTNLRRDGTDFVVLDGGGLAFESSRLMVWNPATNSASDVGMHNNGIAQSLAGGRVAFGVSEFGAAKRDLNGDGDKTDHYIFHVWDPRTGQAVSVGRVGEGIALSGGGLAVGVSEPSEGFDVAGNGNGDDGGRDLNGDGDGGDAVIHIWDGSQLNNLRRVGTPLRALAGNRYVAEVIEYQANRDLNGDGDTTDRVFHIGTGGTTTIPIGDPNPPGSTTTTTRPATPPPPPTPLPQPPAPPGPAPDPVGPIPGPGNSPLVESGSLTDPRNDVAGEDGRSITEPRADILAASAGRQNGQIVVTMQLADRGSPLADRNWDGASTVATWLFDSGRDGQPDRMALVVSGGDGALYGGVTDLSDPPVFLCEAAATAADGILSLSFDAGCLGAEPFAWGAFMIYNQGGPGAEGPLAFDFIPGEGPSPDPSLSTASTGGYWMVSQAGDVYAFGDAAHYGNQPNTVAVDIEPTPSGDGYWILSRTGQVHRKGNAAELGNATLAPGERAVSLSATPSGRGYWIFTDKGRAYQFGDAAHHGDMKGVTLNGPVLGSVATPSGRGYWMVASDGGIFSFGDAAFSGSMGGQRLNRPVMSMAPDPDGKGYWLVSSDGGIFAFDAAFYGSTGNLRLNRPISGMVPGRAGYLMVAEDGGIFAFGDVAFHGSLGANPPAKPVVAVALLP